MIVDITFADFGSEAIDRNFWMSLSVGMGLYLHSCWFLLLRHFLFLRILVRLFVGILVDVRDFAGQIVLGEVLHVLVVDLFRSTFHTDLVNVERAGLLVAVLWCSIFVTNRYTLHTRLDHESNHVTGFLPIEATDRLFQPQGWVTRFP